LTLFGTLSHLTQLADLFRKAVELAVVAVPTLYGAHAFGFRGLRLAYFGNCWLRSRGFWLRSRGFWLRSRGFWLRSRGFWLRSRRRRKLRSRRRSAETFRHGRSFLFC
jgi:hypothetical protein